MIDTFVLLDLDGTVLHLGWGDLEVHRVRGDLVELARQHNLKPPHGMLIPMLAALGAEEPSILDALDAVEAVAARYARPRDGAAALLEALEGRPWAFVTSNGRPCAEAALELAGLASPSPRVMVCRGETRALKPDAEPLRLAVARLTALHGPPARVVMVGDAATDILAARSYAEEARCRVTSIGVLGGIASEPRFREAGATHVLPGLEPLLALLAALPTD